MADPVRLARVLALSFVLACSSGSKPAQPPAPATTATATPPVIALGERTIRFDGHPIARLHADGRTESVGDNTPGPNATVTRGPTFHADGTIDLTKGGIKVRVESDGGIVRCQRRLRDR